MLDFNPYLVRRMKAGQTSTSSELSDDEPLVVMENDMAWDGSFAEPVVGRLPCVECVSSEKFDYDAVLLDEQDVIGMRVCFVRICGGSIDKPFV
jgi:hypothetical protein